MKTKIEETSPMQAETRGFTLIELITVIAIISILAAILFPVFSSVRRSARRIVSISNMRQCGTALIMYCNDYEGLEDMPMRKVAEATLGHQITCDPNDTYRSSCTEEFGAPLVGSYSYTNGADDVLTDDHLRRVWINRLASEGNPILMGSVFYADPVPWKHHGSDPMLPGECIAADQRACYRPNRYIFLYLDGSAKVVTLDRTSMLFQWGYMS